MTFEEMERIHRQKVKTAYETQNTGITAYTGIDRDSDEDNEGSAAARKRMIARSSTNAERQKERYKQRKEQEVAAEREREAFERLHPMEQSRIRAQQEERERREKWARMCGWQSYSDYETAMQQKRRRYDSIDLPKVDYRK